MRREAFTQPRFILCEGFEDAALATGLIATTSRRLPPFDVSPIPDLAKAAGKSGFDEAIIGSDAIRGFENVVDVVIVADNDDGGRNNTSFREIRERLRKAKNEGNLTHDWGVPDRPAVKGVGHPSVSIWMWPTSDQDGCLETVLWRLIENKYPRIAPCVEAAINCSGASTWSISKRDKAKVRCFIAIACKRNPAITLGLVWRELPSLFPLNNPIFNPFARFLAEVAP